MPAAPPPSARDVLGVPLPPAPAVNAVLRMRGRLARLGPAVPPQVAVIERSFGVLDSAALAVLVEVGVPDALERDRSTADELAERLDCDPDALHRLLRYAASRGFLRLDRRGRFRANGVTRVLRSDHPTSLAAWVRCFGSDWYLPIWGRAEHSIRTGRSATEAVTGHDFFEFVQQVRPDAGAHFDAAMADGARLLGLLLAEALDWSGVQRICDVGGGTGRHLADILARAPALTGVLVDLPEVVGRAGPVLAGAGVDDRVDVVGGDFFGSVPTGCDCYLLVAVVHDWDDDRAARILANVRDALPPGGRVLVVENRLHDDEVWELSKASDLMMLVLTGAGRERTRDSMTALARRGGLQVTAVTALANGFDVTEMTAP